MRPFDLARSVPVLLAAVSALAAAPSHARPLQEDAAAERARLERAFEEQLSGVRLVGYFTDSNDPGGPLRKDSYTLNKVTRVAENLFRFDAAVEYGAQAIPISINLPVHWAGDTPMISLTDKAFPLLGTYSARVLFHGDQYAGIWSGSEHGGEMFGRIEPLDAGVEDGASEGNGGPGGPAASDPLVGSGEAAGAGEDGDETHEAGGHWPSFRGPRAAGVAEGHELPTTWHIESGENVLWRVPVAGMAHSSPVIWGDKLFVTSAIRLEGEQELRVGLYGNIDPVENEGPYAFEVYCYDKNDGEQLWSATAWEGEPKYKRHTKGSYAASTPACDAERVVAFFGTEGLYCYDHDGELLWKKDLGDLDAGYYLVKDAQWGYAASPVLHDDKVIVQCDVQQGSFVAALDARTGEELWRTARDEVPTWSTPTVVEAGGRTQVVCNGYKHIGGYDLATGEEIWKLVGGGDIPVPTPIVAHGLVFITNAHGQMAPIYAIDPAKAEGELTMDPEETEAMAWSMRTRGNYMQTPLAYGEEVYFCNDAGILACYDAGTGEENYRERLGGGRTGFTGSGVAADGKLYFCSEEGDVYVVQAGIDFEVLAENSLGEECMSCPAISEGVLYYRTREHLVALR